MLYKTSGNKRKRASYLIAIWADFSVTSLHQILYKLFSLFLSIYKEVVILPYDYLYQSKDF